MIKNFYNCKLPGINMSYLVTYYRSDIVVDKRKSDDSSFAVAHRKRSRYAKIYILIIAVVVIVFGVVFVTETQGSAMPGSKMILHIHPRLMLRLTVTQLLFHKI